MMRWSNRDDLIAALIVLCAIGGSAAAQDKSTPVKPTAGESASTPPPAEDAAGLAEKLSNPVASLISVPLQSNFDFKIGPDDDGWRYQLNVQPVIPTHFDVPVSDMTAG
jgi:hypothetical protein